ncbi:hypothetical protein Dimus_002217 [Dionaea muscipula]
MRGNHLRRRPTGVGRQPPSAQHVPQQQFNRNSFVQNPVFYSQNPSQFPPQNLLLQNPNALIQGLNALFPYPPIPNVIANGPYPQTNIFPVENPTPHVQKANFPVLQHNAAPSGRECLEKIEVAVVKARRELVAAGESVSTWKVSQSVLVALQADSWDSLGFQLQEIPSLHHLIVVEGKINAFINCYVGVRRITSLYDLELAICKNEGIEKFEELELGPLLRHALVMHYFSVGSDVTSVYQITSQEIVSHLSELVYSHKGKSLKVEDFLNFIAKKCQVDSWEKLGVRIQSLGLHITFIREAQSSEDSVLKKCLKTMENNSGKKRKKRPLFSVEKQHLNERFSAITQRITSFSSMNKDFCGKYTRFVSSSSDDDDDVNDGDDEEWVDDGGHNSCQFASKSKSNDRVSNCPYPSVSEEMKRLGLKCEAGGASPVLSSKSSHGKEGKRKKRKSGNLSDSTSSLPQLHSGRKIEQKYLSNSSDDKVMDQNDFEETNLLLGNDSIIMFITTWKEACREHSTAKVLEKMLDFYDAPSEQKNGLKSVFSTYPFLGLLNVAVTSIKNGIWDSMYDTFQSVGDGETDLPSDVTDKFVSIDVEASDPRDSKMQFLNRRLCVTVDDIMSKLKEYFALGNTISGNGSSPLERILFLVRKLSHCEVWLCQQFSVMEFQFLGHGEYLMFLERHSSTVPIELCEFLDGMAHKQFPLEVRVLQKLLIVLLSQATGSLWADESITKQKIFDLVVRQFPIVSFTFTQNGSPEDLLNFVKQQSSDILCSSVLFSATLLGTYNSNDPLDCEWRDSELKGNIGQLEGIPKSVTSKDALEVLLKAPMLCDMNLWSHWDLLYAPSLGPLLGWLLNEVNARDLLCLVTKDGKIVRIDPLASVNSFFQSLLQGSSFQVAVELLSLFALSGGRKHAPVSLMKSHACQAFEVILLNSNENLETIYGHAPKRKLRKSMSGEDAKFTGGLKSEKEAISHSSKLVLDCLNYLPSEFRSFAADVLLCGFQSIVKDASSAVLLECMKPEERLMLHEVGFSLGIIKWIDDHCTICPMADNDSLSSAVITSMETCEFRQDTSVESLCYETNPSSSAKEDEQCEKFTSMKSTIDGFDTSKIEKKHCNAEVNLEKHAGLLIESIRREEFGLDPNLSEGESTMLKKQHARLGRALHCLSQELYSQDSHFLLELVQNADDNVYPEEVEPTLMFILQDTGITVLNNERGFTAKNIKALCDVGSSTKKGSAGYIGQKGIGFKSVFRVTDSPEIHSNGFHVKFDISQGQIGFVLPTIIPPFNMDLLAQLASAGSDKTYAYSWNTCIVLPFRSKLSEGASINSIFSMFSDLNPSLLLFLHRLQCIKLRNMIDDSLIIMRKEIVGNGIVSVSQGKEKTTWFLASKKLRPEVLRAKVEETEISIAFTVKESASCGYDPCLEPQPVFAFLPLRTYGLKFILQGDFVLPSSREEVDGDSPWNQWLLSEFPDLFVSAQKSFCALPCYEGNPGKAVSAYMRFVPLIGEVHGFFSCLPRMIISKLRLSNCLLLEGLKDAWVPPCKVIRGWNGNARLLLPDTLLLKHLGLGFLDNDIILSNSLASSLGIVEYGPKILVKLLFSLSHAECGLKSVELSWLSSLLNEIHNMLAYSSGQAFKNSEELDLINSLRRIPFIPLSDGRYSSLDEGTIWLSTDSLGGGFDGEHGYKDFPHLCATLRIVSPALFSAISSDVSNGNASIVNTVAQMLHKIGVERLSAHEIIKVHILPSISNDNIANKSEKLMTDYLAFVMLHFQSSCLDCQVERENLISQLCNIAFVSTNAGYKRPTEVFIHFSREYGNSVDVNKLFYGWDYQWFEIDLAYLKHPVTGSLPGGLVKWREFFQHLGVTDFIKVVQVQKPITELSHTILQSLITDLDVISPGSIATDWESQELACILSLVSKDGNREKSKYLLEVLDSLWDDYFHDRTAGYLSCRSGGTDLAFKSSFMNEICDVQWVASTMDHGLHYPKELFYDCEAVRSVAGASAPYAIPKIRSGKLLTGIGFKTQVTVDDILILLQVWRRSGTSFTTSISQISNFYTFIWNALSTSRQKVVEALDSGPFIFVPCISWNSREDDVAGVFLSPEEVYWRDITGALDHMKQQNNSTGDPDYATGQTLCNIYPGLFDFFVNECGVNESPPLHQYIQILRQLSLNTLPLQAAKTVFQVFLRWCDGLNCGGASFDDITHFKECLAQLDFTVLPTMVDQWVSLHPSFGLLCWCDDDMLKEEFRHSKNINFLCFGELCHDEKEILRTKVSLVLKKLGIPTLSEVVTREAVYYGPAASIFQASMVDWALPLAQRYIYNFHPQQYEQLRLSRCGFKLRVVVVEKLYYRNVIKRSGIASKKRSECSCLLQDDILYATPESDPHTIFMELSRLFFSGAPEMPFANFLLMIKSMAESGCAGEYLESFLMNGQKMKKLPDEEPVWSLVSSSPENDEAFLLSSASVNLDEQQLKCPNYKKLQPGNSSWPPVGWKTAPDFAVARASGTRVRSAVTNGGILINNVSDSDHVASRKTDLVAMEIKIKEDMIIEDDFVVSTAPTTEDDDRVCEVDESVQVHPSGGQDHSTSSMAALATALDIVVEESHFPEAGPSSKSREMDQAPITADAQQAALVGRLGELVASRYLRGKYGEAAVVRWVNEDEETGLPYDIVIEGQGKEIISKEYIEVKATRYESKGWFFISPREFQFAVDKGDAYSIANVAVSGAKAAKITIYKNPSKLCQLGKLRLAMVIPKS